MTKTQVRNLFLLIAAGLVLGCLVRYWPLITFDFEIALFDVLTLIVTVFLAWWVAKKLEKDSAVERCEKDILIEKLKLMEGIIESVKQKVTATEIVQLSDVIAQIGNFDVLSNRVLGIIEKQYNSIMNEEVDYRGDFELLDNMCTNDNFDGFSVNSIVMDEHNGVSTCMYSQERRDAIETKASEILDKIFNLQLLLNRA